MTTALDVNAYLTSAPRKYTEQSDRVLILNGLAAIITTATLDDLNDSAKFKWYEIALNVVIILQSLTKSYLQRLDADKINSLLITVCSRFPLTAFTISSLKKKFEGTNLIINTIDLQADGIK